MSKTQKTITIVLVLVLIAGVGIGGTIYGKSLSQPVVTHVEQVFADVNGDGQLDLILKGDVILNTGQENLAVSQLNNP